MEPSFQKSFIPKKPITENSSVSSPKVGFLLLLSIFIIVIVGILYGGLSFYKTALKRNIESMKNSLELAKRRFEPEKIAELSLLDRRLNAGTQVLKNHLAISQIFKELQRITLRQVQYTKFTYDLNDLSKNLVEIKMQGKTLNYQNVAIQANIFSERSKNFIQPVFSNLSVDDKGNVLFDLEFKVLRSFIDFEQTLLSERSSIPNFDIINTDVDSINTNTQIPVGSLNTNEPSLNILEELE